jgi:predicted Zn-dependent protease
MRTWDAEGIARLTAPNTALRDSKTGETVDTVRVDIVRNLVEIKKRLETSASQPARFVLADGKEPNAFATRHNGEPVIAVNLAMIRLFIDDYDAYAAVLGHELAHLTLNHGQARKEREAVRTVSSGLLGLVLGRYGIPMSGTIADFGTTSISRSFSREEESAADKLGVKYMRDAGYDSEGAVRAWELMSKNSKSGGLQFLSTHPAPEDRLHEMRKLAAANPRNVISQPKTEVISPVAVGGGVMNSEPPTNTVVTAVAVAQAPVSSVQRSVANPPARTSDLVEKEAINKIAQQREQAIEAAGDLVSQDPTSANAWYRLGAAHLDAKNLDKAIVSFDEALKLNPRFSEAMYGLGTARFAKGEFEVAKELYPKIRKYNPEIAKLYFMAYLVP